VKIQIYCVSESGREPIGVHYNYSTGERIETNAIGIKDVLWRPLSQEYYIEYVLGGYAANGSFSVDPSFKPEIYRFSPDSTEDAWEGENMGNFGEMSDDKLLGLLMVREPSAIAVKGKNTWKIEGACEVELVDETGAVVVFLPIGDARVIEIQPDLIS
jgi:hypothetical protein